MNTIMFCLVLSLLITFVIGSSIIITQNGRRKIFKMNPVGWKVKYWVGEDDYYGTVHSISWCEFGDRRRMILLIDGNDGQLSRFAEDVNPISKHKNGKA